MAEGFARCYGSDVMNVQSAGLAPASIVQLLTRTVMQVKNIDIDGQFPKDLSSIDLREVDLIVNMSGTKLPANVPITIVDWKVEDPIGRSEAIYNKVRDQIEVLVMRLILDLRKRSGETEPSPRKFLGRMGRSTR